MEITLGILSYFIISCTIAIILGIIVGDCEFAVAVGLIWPIGVPIVIIAFIIYAICILLCKIIGFIRKSIEKRKGEIKYDNYKADD